MCINLNNLDGYKTKAIPEGFSSTACIVHLADSADFKGSAFNKLCFDLTVSCFESPNDTIHAKRSGTFS